MKKILFADDDPEIREVVRILLARDGYEVVEAVNGIEAVEKADHTIDLIILDVMMPGCSGVEACGEIRKKSSAPILFLTAKSRDRDKEEGFAAGGDDYLVKPFDLSELTARIWAVSRRYAGNPNPRITLGTLAIDLAGRSILGPDGAAIDLSQREWAIFEALLRAPGAVLSRARLEEHLYSFDAEVESNTIEVYVSRLRRKLGRGSIETLRGLGYRLGRP